MRAESGVWHEVRKSEKKGGSDGREEGTQSPTPPHSTPPQAVSPAHFSLVNTIWTPERG